MAKNGSARGTRAEPFFAPVEFTLKKLAKPAFLPAAARSIPPSREPARRVGSRDGGMKLIN
jgi:hypothetical protein